MTREKTTNPQAKLVAEIKPSTWEHATDTPETLRAKETLRAVLDSAPMASTLNQVGPVLRAVLDCLDDDEASKVEEAIEVTGARLRELIDGYRPLFWTEAERAEHDTLLKNYATLLRTSCFLTTGIDPQEV